MEKDRLKGINISSELVLLNISGVENFFVSVSPFFQALKKNKINTPFLSTTFSAKGGAAVSCCFAKEDIERVKEIVQKNDSLKKNAYYIHEVGLLSVFPHRFSLNAFSLSLAVLRRANLPLLGMSSSISSLIFVLKHNTLGKAVDSLKASLF
ncbi:MAG: hypothetical protein R6X10_16775 [Desulfobacterales bacterium]